MSAVRLNRIRPLLVVALFCICVCSSLIYASDDPARDFGFIDFSTESPTFILVTDKNGRFAGVYPHLDETKRIPDSRSGLSTMGGPGGMNGAMIVHPYKENYRVELLSQTDTSFMLHISADAPGFVRKFNGFVRGTLKQNHPLPIVVTYDPDSNNPPKVASESIITTSFKSQ